MTIIEKYNNLQKEILSNFAIKWKADNCKTTFRDDVKNFYGFEKKFGWNIILNAYYIIDDKELAKESFKKFDLQGPSRHQDIGERYLRLYGFLNAVYQQKLAVENLMEVFKLKGKKAFLESLKVTELIELRNKIAAHPSNYNDIKLDSEHKFDVFEISRPDLESGKIRLLRNQKDIEEFGLIQSIKLFDMIIEEILSNVVGKIIKKLFNNQGKLYSDYIIINKQKNGAILIGDTLIEFNNNKA